MSGLELLFVVPISLVSLGLPVAIIFFAIRALNAPQQTSAGSIIAPLEGERTATCVRCGSVYRAVYTSCPYCSGQTPAQGAIDVTTWSVGKTRALLFATAWTPLYILMFLGAALVSTWANSDRVLTAGPIPLIWFGVHIATMLLGLALLIVYVAIAVKSPISSNAKVLWALAAILGSQLAHPFAFYYLVWRPRKGSPSVVVNPSAAEAHG